MVRNQSLRLEDGSSLEYMALGVHSRSRLHDEYTCECRGSRWDSVGVARSIGSTK